MKLPASGDLKLSIIVKQKVIVLAKNQYNYRKINTSGDEKMLIDGFWNSMVCRSFSF
jgi:hypothetical protein